MVLITISFSHADNLNKSQDDLKAIQSQIEGLLKKIDRDEQALGKQRSELNKIEQEIVTINQKQGELTTDIGNVRIRMQTLKANTDAEREAISMELTRLGKIVLSQHAMGENSYLKLLLGQNDPGSIERAMVYYKYLAQLTSSQVESGREQLRQLVLLEEQLADEQGRLNQLLETQKKQQQQLKQAGEKRQQMIASLDRELTQSANQVGRLKQDETRIRKLVSGLQEAARQRELARARAAAELARDQQLAVAKSEKNNSVAKSSTTTITKPVIQRVSNDGLGKFKGQLKMPVSGTIQAGYGSSKSGSGIKWNGIMLAVQDGEPVHSIYDGQIVYADWFRGFGELVIVDHGKGYMSLYSHNSRLTRTPGELVKANDVIAYSGSSGGLAHPGLYFEVRYNGEPRDPLLWVKR